MRSFGERYKEAWTIAFILLAVSLAFSSSLSNGFTGWDDPVHLTDDPVVHSLSVENVKKMFTRSINATYVPLMSLSFAVEYHFFKKNPFVYHLNNLLLHLIVCWLVFVLGRKMGFSWRAVLIASLVFGLHPMRVESVAWVTERKDVLYAVFYMAALCCYWRYLDNYRFKWYAAVLVFGLLSILSKPMGLSLPLVLLVLDFYKRREIDQRIWLEKVPFVLVMGGIALITYLQNVRIPGENGESAVLIWAWTFWFHIVKFFIPMDLSPIYTLPQPVAFENIIYYSSLAGLIILIIVLWKFRHQKILMGAFLFYFASIFFLLRFDDVADKNIVADRFMYLPSLGFCYGLGFLVDRYGFKSFKMSFLSTAFLIFVFIGMAVATNQQCRIWKDNFTLWNYTIQKSPRAALAYLNRGEEYIRQRQFDLALKDTDQAILLNPAYAKAYNNRGNIYFYTNQFDRALEEYEKAILLYPGWALPYNNRGVLYSERREYGPALDDFQKAIGFDPQDASVYANRANVYTKLMKLDEAQKDCQKALELNAESSASHHSCGNVATTRGDWKAALVHFTAAIEADPGAFKSLNNRCHIFYRTREWSKALADCSRAIELNPSYASAYLNRALVYEALGQREWARQDLDNIQGADTLNFKSQILELRKRLDQD